MQKAKIGTILLTAALISGAVPITALADTEITSISLDISSDIVPGDDNNNVDVSSNSSRYDVDDVEVTNEPSSDWDEGDEPRVRVTLEADNDYYFSSDLSEDDVELSGDDAEVTDVSRSSRSRLRVTIRLAELTDEDYDGEYDLDVSGLEWDDYDGTAYWMRRRMRTNMRYAFIAMAIPLPLLKPLRIPITISPMNLPEAATTISGYGLYATPPIKETGRNLMNSLLPPARPGISAKMATALPVPAPAPVVLVPASSSNSGGPGVASSSTAPGSGMTM